MTTGAKRLRDFEKAYTGNTQRGLLRTKPRCSDLPLTKKTRSLSCSDNILKWCVLDFQEALVNTTLILPLYLESILIENKDVFDVRLRQAIDLRMRSTILKQKSTITSAELNT
jgi:hypothetical protein